MSEGTEGRKGLWTIQRPGQSPCDMLAGCEGIGPASGWADLAPCGMASWPSGQQAATGSRLLPQMYKPTVRRYPRYCGSYLLYWSQQKWGHVALQIRWRPSRLRVLPPPPPFQATQGTGTVPSPCRGRVGPGRPSV